MNIESYHDLQKLSANVIHYIQIIGLLEEIKFDGNSYIIAITQFLPNERLYYIKLRYKDQQRKYLYILLKWILFTLKQNSINVVSHPFHINKISQSYPILLDCQCKYLSKLNGDSGIFLSDMTPVEYDPLNDTMKNIMDRYRSTLPSIDSIGPVISQYSQSNLNTTNIPIDNNDTSPLFNLKRISDSQDDYNSQRVINTSSFKKPRYHAITAVEEAGKEMDTDSPAYSDKFIRTVDQLLQIDDVGATFQYIGYITGYVKVSPDWYRYNTILMSRRNDVTSGVCFIEVYGQSGLQVGQYEFYCKTWQREYDSEMIEYLIVSYNSISGSSLNKEKTINNNENEEEKDDSVSKFNDQIIMFKELSLQNEREKFIRIVGLCVSITNENPKFVSLCLTDFTINENERVKYLFDRYIDSWECYKLRLNEGYRVIMYPNFFKEFNKDIQRLYDGKSIFELTSGMTGNVSHQRIVVELTLRATRYGDLLNLVVRGHKILSCGGSSIERKCEISSSDLIARTARILTICKEIKYEYSKKNQKNVLVSSPINSNEYIIKTEPFKITKIFNISLTYGGKEFGYRKDKQIEILCKGELLESKFNQDKNLIRIVINTPDLFFFGSEKDLSDDINDCGDNKDVKRRFILTEAITKLRNKPVKDEVTITDLVMELPQSLHFPVLAREARDLVLQQLY